MGLLGRENKEKGAKRRKRKKDARGQPPSHTAIHEVRMKER